MRRNTPSTQQKYVLGHSQNELDRLVSQARRIDPITERIFEAAGLRPGMRVLDVGSGGGDVAFLVSRMVGKKGAVVGTDRELRAVEVARQRTTVLGLGHVSFLLGDPAELAFEKPFDAVVGRYVLQFQPNPATMLRKLAKHLCPGGLLVFHEVDHSGVRSLPTVPTYEQCRQWIAETLRLGGADIHIGAKLHSVFIEAGLSAPSMRLESLVGGGHNAADCLRIVADLAATLLPEMERLGVATPGEVGLDTIFDRMQNEVEATNATVIGHAQIGAWSLV